MDLNFGRIAIGTQVYI